MTNFFLSANSIRLQNFIPKVFRYGRIQVFNLFFGREGGREGEDERFLRDILEFLHLNRIYHVGKYFETLERKIFGQFFEGGRSKYFLIFQLCRMLNGVDNIGKYFRSKKLNLGKKVV